MRRYLCLLLMSFMMVGVYAQSGMSDSEVMDFIGKETKKGTPNAQIVTKLMQNHVDISQIRRVRSQYEKIKSGGGVTTTNIENAEGGSRGRVNNSDPKQAYQQATEKVEQNSDYRIRPMSYDRPAGSDYVEGEQMNGMLSDMTGEDKEKEKSVLYFNRKRVFGHDFFNREDLSFEPVMNIATPANYRLGPGDAVYIDIYGASQKSTQSTVSPDGDINIDGFGPIQVSGLTVAQANARLRSTLGSRYSSSKVRLTVGQTKTILVNVMGEVKKPGTYTLSAFATVFHALHMAGGVTDLGTLRNIKVYRNGALVSVVDVYDYMLNGKLTGNVRLSDNDVIVVGAYDCLVNIAGKVKRPMYYEMKKNESLGTLIRYAGGFTGDAYTKSVRVIRKNGRQYSIYTVNEFDAGSFRVADEDSVSIDSVIARYENMVQVKGAVFRPGMYQVGEDINSVRSLLEAAEGVTEEAFIARAIIHRMREDRSLEVIPVDVKGIMDGSVADIALQNEDVLFIPTRQDVQEEQTLTIHGEVQYPGIYKYAANETLEDFILQAGGLRETASTVKVDVARRVVNPEALQPDSAIAQTFSFALKDGFVIDGEPGFILKPFDHVYVRRSPGYNNQQNVFIDGEVMFSGAYTMIKRDTRLSDLVKLSGGFTDMAYVQGARLIRQVNADERARMESILRMESERQQKNLLEMAASSQNGSFSDIAKQTQQKELEKFNIPDSYPVGIELEKAIAKPGGDADILLREGDRLVVPRYNGTVKINGAVLYPNSVSYVPGKSVSYYIDQAGGFGNEAKKRDTYVLYMNGMVAKVGHNAKVRPGCEIVVPTKRQSRMGLAEKLAIGTSTATIATMIATIANMAK